MAAREVDGVVIFQAGVRQMDRPPHHLCRADDRLQIESDLRAAGHLGAQAHHVHGRDHPVGGGDHYLMAGLGERLVRGRELLGPVTRRVPGAVLERPVRRAGHHEK